MPPGAARRWYYLRVSSLTAYLTVTANMNGMGHHHSSGLLLQLRIPYDGEMCSAGRLQEEKKKKGKKMGKSKSRHIFIPVFLEIVKINSI